MSDFEVVETFERAFGAGLVKLGLVIGEGKRLE